ncbi:MAG: hypothetical protein MJ016_03785 [Victivallaceae bacterium]|nr:hypothetical protein [Victivallaceae bacterium]
MKARAEKKFSGFLEGRAIPSYLPFLRKWRLHHGSKVSADIPMFPGYVFLAPSDDEIPEVKRNDALVCFRRLEACQEADFLAELADIRRCEEASVTNPVAINPGLVPGRKAEVVSGPFKGMRVVVLRRLDEVRIAVNFELFGQSCDIKISAAELKTLE